MSESLLGVSATLTRQNAGSVLQIGAMFAPGAPAARSCLRRSSRLTEIRVFGNATRASSSQVAALTSEVQVRQEGRPPAEESFMAAPEGSGRLSRAEQIGPYATGLRSQAL